MTSKVPPSSISKMNNANVDDTFPLSPLQHGMLYHHIQQPNKGVDIQQMVACCKGVFDKTAFLDAWRAVFKTHAALRIRFQWEGKTEPIQEVLSGVEPISQYFNYCAYDSSEQQARLDTYLLEDRRKGFDLAQIPLSRLAIFWFSELEFRFVWTFPHIILDGSSFKIVVQDVFSAYESLLNRQVVSLLSPPPSLNSLIG